jgi:hypothetical protein
MLFEDTVCLSSIPFLESTMEKGVEISKLFYILATHFILI